MVGAAIQCQVWWIWGLEVVGAEERRGVEGAGEGASAVGEERQETDDGECDGPDLALVAQLRDLVLRRELLAASEEGGDEAPHQAEYAASDTTEAEGEGSEEQQYLRNRIDQNLAWTDLLLLSR
jgi:hypothetical protein